MGEVINLVNDYKVDNVIFNCGEYNDLENELIDVLDKKHIEYYSCIKELNIDKYKLQFLNSGKVSKYCVQCQDLLLAYPLKLFQP